MQWVDNAEEYAGSHGWGARGKQIGISRMLNDSDLTHIANIPCVAAIRPRGIISGFLVIVPKLGYSIFLPPIAARMGPVQIKCRYSQTLLEKGAILSAYMMRDSATGTKTLIVEDVLVWLGENVWYSNTLQERWNLIRDLFENHFAADVQLQKCFIRPQEYKSLLECTEPPEEKVLEICPNQKGQKRLIWNAPKEKRQDTAFIAKHEVGAGPDVYVLFRGEERLGQALIRTLAISKAIRKALKENACVVQACFNKQFEKWEITEVKSSA